MPTAAPALSLVVSSVGRADTFRRLLETVQHSTCRDLVEVVLIDQSPAGSCRAVADAGGWDFPIRVGTSARGASIGRNAGVRLATAPLIAFPDDDAYYPPSTLADIVARFEAQPGLAGLSGQQQTADGRPSMLRWRSRPGRVTRTNFLHTSIMSTMVFRRSWLERVGEFDEAMGVGAPGWYHAGEESDLVLRVVEAGGQVGYDPTIVVWQDEPRDVPDEAFVRKMLEYGCGQGHLWRKRRLSRALLAWYLGRKLVAASVRTARGRRTLARADLAWVQGNVAGLRDRRPAALASLGSS
jgi:GT2 family glycosyltransferase